LPKNDQAASGHISGARSQSAAVYAVGWGGRFWWPGCSCSVRLRAGDAGKDDLDTKVFPGEPGPDRVVSHFAMGVFDQRVRFPPSCDPFPPVWRMRCLCSFRAGRVGEIAACGCRFWWRVGKRGRWYAISKRRAFRALVGELGRELSSF
jgi:hypothetical protein